MNREPVGKSGVTVIVDVSNVARDDKLPGCGAAACWDRVETVRRAWCDMTGSDSGVLLIADASLIHHLGDHCRRGYQRMRTAQDVLVHDVADTEILALAEVVDAAIVSRDYFKDHRSAYPWIQGNTDRFFVWTAVPNGVQLRPRDMGVATEFTMSQRQEEGELKGSGIDIRSGRNLEAARHKYRCNTRSCLWHQWNPTVLLSSPVVGRDGVARCPACEEALQDLGVSDRLVQVKIRGRNDETVRIHIAPGSPLIVGRDGDIASEIATLLGDEVAKVSRHHAALRWDGSNLTIEDLGSTNGTFVERWLADGHANGAPQRVDDVWVLRPRDRVRIGSALTITRSGRRYHREDDRARDRGGHDRERTVLPGAGPSDR
jgi:hypothetical protein